jgi:hypothetical protein
LKKNTDSDGDGVYDKEDACPNTPGLKSINGCPDSDGDGVLDKDDRCPNEAGLALTNGCPNLDEDYFFDLDLLPIATASMDISSYFNGLQNMKEVNNLLLKSLDLSGYNVDNKYFLVENGFILFTPIEQIDSNGFSVPENIRWVRDRIWQPKESFLERIRRVLGNEQFGHYRSFVFVISTKVISLNQTIKNATELGVVLSGGTITLDNYDLPFTDDHNVTIHVYEFTKSEFRDEILFLRNTSLKSVHFNNSKILNYLRE